jgi:hypothetical protein
MAALIASYRDRGETKMSEVIARAEKRLRDARRLAEAFFGSAASSDAIVALASMLMRMEDRHGERQHVPEHATAK